MKEGFHDFYRRHPVYAGYPQEHRQVGSVPVSLIRSRKAAFEADDDPMDAIVLGLALIPTLPDLEVDFGEGRRRFSQRSGQVYVTPSFSGARYRADGYSDVLFLSVNLAGAACHLERDKGEVARAIRPLHDRPLDDAFAFRLGLTIWDAATEFGAAASLFVDQSLSLLLLRLIQAGTQIYSGSSSGPPEPLPAVVSSRRMRRVVDYIDANIDTALTIAELAAVAHYSPCHFARVFRKELGLSPHDFVMRRRLKCAENLMVKEPGISLAAVAAACGFASHSHLTRVFRKLKGHPPARWRQSALTSADARVLRS